MAAAQDRRFEAIGAITKGFKIDDHRPVSIIPVEELTTAIRSIAPLGRTDRWKNAVERWAQLIEEEATDRPEVREWALTQGAIWAGAAA